MANQPNDGVRISRQAAREDEPHARSIVVLGAGFGPILT